MIDARTHHDPAKPSIRSAATLIGKSPGTLHRWKTTNPHLYRAVMEYAERVNCSKASKDEGVSNV